MKKIALTSLLAVFTAVSANAANVINNNPLYRPMAGHFFDVVGIESHSEHTDTWGVYNTLGYGFTDHLMATVSVDAAEADWFDASAWGATSVGLNYRALDLTNWKADVFGSYTVSPTWAYHEEFLDKDLTEYTWTAGVQGGFTNGEWTVAGHVALDYLNSESFNWGDEGLHILRAGVDAQWVLDSDWNLTAGVEYAGVLDDEDYIHNAGSWTGEFGINYNLDETKFIGLYVDGTVAHGKPVAPLYNTGDWEFQDGFGFGAKFGIEF